MMQVIEQSREEKIAMYMKLEKSELIAMLLTNQELVAGWMLRQPQQFVAAPMGCVCPAGTVCGNNMCPRRTFPGPSFSGTTCGINGQAHG